MDSLTFVSSLDLCLFLFRQTLLEVREHNPAGTPLSIHRDWSGFSASWLVLLRLSSDPKRLDLAQVKSRTFRR